MIILTNQFRYFYALTRCERSLYGGLTDIFLCLLTASVLNATVDFNSIPLEVSSQTRCVPPAPQLHES